MDPQWLKLIGAIASFIIAATAGEYTPSSADKGRLLGSITYGSQQRRYSEYDKCRVVD